MELRQRIEERGWVSKATYNLVKAFDTVTGGFVRGATDAVLSRGTGLKTLNALDLESNLQRNLSVIRKAMSANTEKEAQSFLKEAVDAIKGKKNPGGFINIGETFSKNSLKIAI